VIVQRSFQSIMPVRYVSVATGHGSTGLWTVCAKECKRMVYTNDKKQYVSIGEIEAMQPPTEAWRAEFWPELNKKAGMISAVSFNKNSVFPSLLPHMNARAPWNKISINTISLSVPAGSETWTGLDSFKYGSGEQSGVASENPIYTNYFAARFTATINIPTKEVYYLYTWVDDGAMIKLDGQMRHQLDGYRDTMKWEMSEVEIDAGDIKFEVTYFQYTGTSGIWVMWGTKTGVGKAGKCGTDTPSSITCSKSFITLPHKVGGSILNTDFGSCGAEGGSLTVKAWKNLNFGTSSSVAGALTLTEKSPDKVFQVNSIYFENTASFFPGLDSAFTNNFAMKVEGYFKAKKAGKYKFWLVSDDGSQLWLDNRWFLNQNIPMVVDNDGAHGIQGIAPWAEKSKEIELDEGYFHMTAFMYDVTTPSTASDLEVYVQTPDDTGPRLLTCDDLTHSHMQETSKWAYVGCYQDEQCMGGDHDLPIRKGSNGISVESCYQLCTGYRYFGQQRDRQCYCGNKYGSGSPAKGTLEYKPLPTPAPDAAHYKPKGCKCDAPAALPGIGECKQCTYERKDQGERDLAFGMKCSASKAPKPEEAWRAVDGLTNHGAFINQGNAPANSRSMACAAIREIPGQDSWWRVDMGTNQRVESFAVTGLSDGVEESSSGWEARVGDWKNDGKSDSVCATQINAYKGTHWFACDGGSRQGRYFSLWKYNANMVICEVQVYGDTQDLAFGKVTEQSSIKKLASGAAASGASKKAVDGNTDGNYAHSSCTRTDPDDSNPPWWRVDLGGPASVDSVTIWNRSDCCGDRLFAQGHEFEVRVGDDGKSYEKNDKCGDKHTIDPPALSKLIPCDKKIGQYVYIDIPFGHRTLTLCEVRVMGAHVVEDVAKDKPCGQSSGETCGRAVDGDTNGAMSGGSCTITEEQNPAWWYVDLQDEFKISEVQVWGRTDCCGDRLSNFQVRVGDTKPTSGTYIKNRACNSQTDEGKVDYAEFNRDDPIKPSITVSCNREPGTYVSINIPDRADYLTLCEVKVFGQASNKVKANLALGKPASQIDVGYGGVASRAVDGNTDTSFGAESCTHTNKKQDPWWKVDLQKTAEISRVIVWNRSDCCGSRLEDFEVRVGEMEDIYQNAVCGGPNKVDLEGNTPKIINCEKKTGRYVSVDLKGKNQWLTVCEVKVNGEWAESGMQLGKPTKQSSTMNAGYSKRAVDGNTDGKFAGNSCTQTNVQANPWWFVDLEKPASVSKVSVFNRADCCGDKIANFEVRVGNMEPQGMDFTANPTCGSIHWPDAPKTGGGEFTVDCDEQVGRYVTIDLPGDNKQLTLCEVRIMGAFTTPAFSKCKTSVEAIEADLEKVRGDEKTAKSEVAKLKVGHGDLVAKLNKDLQAAKDDEAATKKDAHAITGKHEARATVSKSQHDQAVKSKETEIEKYKADAKAQATKTADLDRKRQAAVNAKEAHAAACTKQQKNDADMIEQLKADHSQAAQQCLSKARQVKDKHDALTKKNNEELKQEKKAHEDSVIAHKNSAAANKKKCQEKETLAREEGRKAGLQACPGVNGLMREIWRLRQKLGAAEASNGEEEEQR